MHKNLCKKKELEGGEKMKKLIAFGALVLAVVVTGYSVSGTYAKYTSNETVTDTAKVAKWSFTVGGQDLAAVEKSISVNIFKTATKDSLIGKNSESGIIAPGTEGKATITVKNASEVKARFSFSMAESGSSAVKGLPLQFAVKMDDDSGSVSEEDYKSLADAKLENIAINDSSDHTITIYWRWKDASVSDAADTAFGTASVTGTTDYVVDITLKAEQAAVSQVGA